MDLWNCPKPADEDVGGQYTAARPTILLDGQPSPAVGQDLLSLLVEEAFEGIYRCEITLANVTPGKEGGTYKYLDNGTLTLGKSLAVEIAGKDGPKRIFHGRIMGLEGRFPRNGLPEVVVLAEDSLQDLRMTRRTRTFENATDAAAIKEIARGYGLRTNIKLTGPEYPTLVQCNQSDLAFIRDRARALDAEVWIAEEKLTILPHSDRAKEKVKITYNRELWEFTVLADLAGQRSSLTVTGWDPHAKQAVRVQSDPGKLSAELAGLTSGASILQSALGERPEQLVHTAPFGQDEAQAMADAAFGQIARRFVTGAGLCSGDNRLRVGVTVDLQGLGHLFSGKYYVTEVRHLYDEQNGYRTEFRVQRPGIGE